jgi:drug/metabolite transporter (DMT)-like permease
MNPQVSRRAWLLLASLALGWGFNWPMMKIALAKVPLWSYRGLCCYVAGIALLCIARASGQSIAVARRHWVAVVWIALFNVAVWNVLSAIGVALLPSGRAAILAYTMPVWSILMAWFFLGERLLTQRFLALVAGMAGMALLLTAELRTIGGEPVGTVIMLTSALGWAYGTILLKRDAPPIPATVLTAWMLLIGGTPFVFGAIGDSTDWWRALELRTALAVAYTVLVSFVYCYWAWFKLALMLPVATSSLGSLMVPVIGVIGGMSLLGETPRWSDYAALVCVAAAIVLALRTPATRT